LRNPSSDPRNLCPTTALLCNRHKEAACSGFPAQTVSSAGDTGDTVSGHDQNHPHPGKASQASTSWSVERAMGGL